MGRDGYSKIDTRLCKNYIKSVGYDPIWINKAEYRKHGLLLVLGKGEGRRPSESLLKTMSFTLFGDASAPMIMEGSWLKTK